MAEDCEQSCSGLSDVLVGREMASGLNGIGTGESSQLGAARKPSSAIDPRDGHDQGQMIGVSADEDALDVNLSMTANTPQERKVFRVGINAVTMRAPVSVCGWERQAVIDSGAEVTVMSCVWTCG